VSKEVGRGGSKEGVGKKVGGDGWVKGVKGVKERGE
jgi:hypothetical protein